MLVNYHQPKHFYQLSKLPRQLVDYLNNITVELVNVSSPNNNIRVITRKKFAWSLVNCIKLIFMQQFLLQLPSSLNVRLFTAKYINIALLKIFDH